MVEAALVAAVRAEAAMVAAVRVAAALAAVGLEEQQGERAVRGARLEVCVGEGRVVGGGEGHGLVVVWVSSP